MFKATIILHDDSDLVAELDRIEVVAQKHHLESIKRLALLRDLETVIADLKTQSSEATAYGIAISVKKQLKTDDYDITIQLATGKHKKKPLLGLFGR